MFATGMAIITYFISVPDAMSEISSTNMRASYVILTYGKYNTGYVYCIATIRR